MRRCSQQPKINGTPSRTSPLSRWIGKAISHQTVIVDNLTITIIAPGFSIHDELQTFVKCGLTPWAALQTATVNPAAYLGFIPGQVPLLLLLFDANPLEDITNSRVINTVFNGAQVYDRRALDTLLGHARNLGQ